MPKTPDDLLSNREKDILVLVGRGLTNQEIADQLWISMRTVKCILHRACVKLEVRTRDQAVLKGLRDRAIGIQDMYSIEEMAELMASLPPELIAMVAQRVEQRVKQNNIGSDARGTIIQR